MDQVPVTTDRSLRQAFDDLCSAITLACVVHYGRRLRAVAVFGSVGRGTMRRDSDIDLLVVADDLPDGRGARVEEFDAVERALSDPMAMARRQGLDTRLSPVFKTVAELAAGSPLMLDMIDDARMLYDPTGALAEGLRAFQRRLDKLGAQRIWRDGMWYWDLKPDYRPGEIFEI